MRRSHIWLSISMVFVLMIAAGIGHFLWKNNRSLPSIDQVEFHFEKEIKALIELTDKINLEELYYRPRQALPRRGIDEARQLFSESGLLSASVSFRHPGSRNKVYVVHDNSLNLWSLSPSPEDVGSYVSFYYSGLRQLIKYERVTATISDQTVGFEIVFPPEELINKNDSGKLQSREEIK